MEPQGRDRAAGAPDLALLLRAVSDPQRLALLAELARSPRSVGELVQTSGLAQASVSHHLAILRRADVVDAIRDGRHQRHAWSRPEPGTPRAGLLRWLHRWLLPDHAAAPAPLAGNQAAPVAYPGVRRPHLDDHLL